MPTSARWAVANLPKITVKTLRSAGPMRCPQASFEAQPRIARLLAPKMGIGPYNHTSRYIRIRRKLPGKPLPSAGGQRRPPLRELRKNCAESNNSGLFQLESDVVAVELEETIRTQQA